MRFVKGYSLFKGFGVYFGSSVLNAIVPFVLLPVFTRYLTQSDYGIVAMFSILSSFLSALMGFSSEGILSVEYYRRTKEEFSKIVGNIFYILASSLFITVLIFYAFKGSILEATELSERVIWLVIVFSFFNFVFNVCLTIWQIELNPMRYGFFQIGQASLNVLFSLALVVFLHLGWAGRVWSQVFSIAAFAILAFYLLFKRHLVKLKYERTYFSEALNFGLPLIPHTVGAIVMSMSDRFFITNMVGIEATGLYAVGYSIGGIIGFVENAFNKAYVPWLFKKLELNDELEKRKIVRFTYVYFAAILFLVFALTMLSTWIFDFFIDQKFKDSQQFVFWVALSFAFSGMYKMVANYIFYVKKTKYLAWVTFASAILNVILNYFLINIIGVLGAAISTAIVSLFFFLTTWFLSSRLFEMPWSLKRISAFNSGN